MCTRHKFRPLSSSQTGLVTCRQPCRKATYRSNCVCFLHSDCERGSPQLEAAQFADGASEGCLPVHPPEVLGTDLSIPVRPAYHAHFYFLTLDHGQRYGPTDRALYVLTPSKLLLLRGYHQVNCAQDVCMLMLWTMMPYRGRPTDWQRCCLQSHKPLTSMPSLLSDQIHHQCTRICAWCFNLQSRLITALLDFDSAGVQQPLSPVRKQMQHKLHTLHCTRMLTSQPSFVTFI